MATIKLCREGNIGIHGLGLNLTGCEAAESAYLDLREDIPGETWCISLARLQALAIVLLLSQRRLADIFHLNFLSCLSYDILQTHPSRNLLLEGHDESTVLLFYAERLQHLRDAVGGRSVGRKLSHGCYGFLRRMPTALITIGLCPPGCFQTRIINFAVIDASQSNGRRACEPRLISTDTLLCPIVIGHLHLEKQTRLSEGTHMIAGGAVESIAQHGPNRITAALQQVCDIVGEIEDAVCCEAVLQSDAAFVQPLASRVVGEVRDQLVLPHPLTVHIKLEVAPSGNISFGFLHLPF